MLLGYIIEDVAKMPYEQAVRNYIFKPLKMDHSGFDFTHLSSKNKATGYFRLTEETISLLPLLTHQFLIRQELFIQRSMICINGINRCGQTIISKASKEKAFTPVKNKYGYGWGIDSAGKRRVGHGGGIHGFNRIW